MYFRYTFLESIYFKFVFMLRLFVSGYKFQENLLKTMLQIENTFFELGESCSRDCLIICDRGAMDASACESNTIVS